MLIVGIVTDLIWTPYIRALADKDYDAASWWSMATGLCSLLVFQGFLVYKLTCIFWLIGLNLGTRIAGKMLDKAAIPRKTV